MSSFKINNVYIDKHYSIVGPLEAKGNINNYNEVIDDYYFKEKTFEKAEIKMQKRVIDNLITKDINLIISGDLSNQIANSSYTVRNNDISYLGIYSACASFIESIIIASRFINDFNNILCLTSSHNLTAEKEFRYPIEYGSPRKKTSTFTATGSVGAIITNHKTNIKIESATIGKVTDLDWKDPNHFGAAMAPAAASTLYNHLNDLNRDINYYDLILTGDLGKVGSLIFKEYLLENYNLKIKNHLDAGATLYKDDKYSGSSGPVTLPLVFFNNILNNKKYKKILLIATGALHSPLMLNQKETIPSIAHAISLEVSR